MRKGNKANCQCLENLDMPIDTSYHSRVGSDDQTRDCWQQWQHQQLQQRQTPWRSSQTSIPLLGSSRTNSRPCGLTTCHYRYYYYHCYDCCCGGGGLGD